MGNDAVTHFKKGFRDGGFTDETLEKWKPRKRRDRKRQGRAILVDKGHLKKSIKVVKKSFNSVTIGSRTAGDYGEVHNEGLMAGRRGGRFKMPKRKFMGDSFALTKKLRKKLNTRIVVAFNV